MKEAALRILASDEVWPSIQADVESAMGSRPWTRVSIDKILASEEGADVAFVSRDVTGASTKHKITPSTQRFYDALTAARDLRWLHVHSAGADRFIYLDLMARGVTVTTSSGANSNAVAQTALTGLLALARGLPSLLKSQAAHRWDPLIKTGLPPDLDGQTATIVGWGPIGQTIGQVLHVLGVELVVVRRSNSKVDIAKRQVSFDRLQEVLPQTDWLILACPLNDETTNLISREALSKLKKGASIVNIARGAVIDEQAMIERLGDGSIASAYLDVFAQEPLPESSPLWDMPNVIATPHTAGFSFGMYRRMEKMFTDNLARYARGESLVHIANPS